MYMLLPPFSPSPPSGYQLAWGQETGSVSPVLFIWWDPHLGSILRPHHWYTRHVVHHVTAWKGNKPNAVSTLFIPHNPQIEIDFFITYFDCTYVFQKCYIAELLLKALGHFVDKWSFVNSRALGHWVDTWTFVNGKALGHYVDIRTFVNRKALGHSVDTWISVAMRMRVWTPPIVKVEQFECSDVIRIVNIFHSCSVLSPQHF